jgi:hypothetical protein
MPIVLVIAIIAHVNMSGKQSFGDVHRNRFCHKRHWHVPLHMRGWDAHLQIVGMKVLTVLPRR